MGCIIEQIEGSNSVAQNLIRTRTHGDIYVFHFHFSDFADFEDFNRPVLQEGALCYVGCNMEGFEGLNFVQTDSDSHKNPWRYSAFSFPFCHFEDFNRPAFQEGAVYS